MGTMIGNFFALIVIAEVKSCLAALEDVRPAFANILFADHVFTQVKSAVTERENWPHILSAVQQAGNTPREGCSSLSCRRAGSFLQADNIMCTAEC